MVITRIDMFYESKIIHMWGLRQPEAMCGIAALQKKQLSNFHLFLTILGSHLSSQKIMRGMHR
jgi:hypothetical protein